MPSLVNHDGFDDVRDPNKWQLFEAPQLAPCLRIYIPLQNYPEWGKFVIDNEFGDDDTPGHDEQENAPVTSPITRKTSGLAPKVLLLQVINPNLCSSYIRKVKGTKGTVILSIYNQTSWIQTRTKK
jgi:hypothetical protein